MASKWCEHIIPSPKGSAYRYEKHAKYFFEENCALRDWEFCPICGTPRPQLGIGDQFEKDFDERFYNKDGSLRHACAPGTVALWAAKWIAGEILKKAFTGGQFTADNQACIRTQQIRQIILDLNEIETQDVKWYLPKIFGALHGEHEEANKDD